MPTTLVFPEFSEMRFTVLPAASTVPAFPAAPLRRSRLQIAVHFYALVVAAALTFGNNQGASAAPAASTSAPQSLSTLQRDWLAARAAFDRRDIAGLASARDRFSTRKDFPLSPYVTWWWLSAQLAQGAQAAPALGAEIERFALDHPDAPFTDQLRRDYLRALGKLGLWQPFAANQGKYRGDDGEVACQRLRYRMIADDRALLPSAMADAKALLVAAKPVSDPCYDVFERLLAGNAITNDDLWLRARALFDAGQLADARRTSALIPNLPAGFEAATASANLDARHFLLKSVARASDRSAGELLLFAITRLARTNPEAAAQWLDKNEMRLPNPALAHAWAQIGYQGAMQLHSEALTWFGRAAAIDGYKLNDQQAGWLVRAALRATAADATKWELIRGTINRMSEGERRDATWRYWLARATIQTAKGPTAQVDLATARAARETLANENHFYGVLAAEELGRASVPNFQPNPPTPEALARIGDRPGVKRTFAMYQLADLKPDVKDLRNDAFREWVFALRDADDETLLAAAEAAKRQGLPDRAINTAERTKTVHDFAQRYPLPHRETLQVQAQTFGLDEAWVFGLIRQESRFITDARSRVGAIGLMQLMPATAKWAAKQVGVKDYTVDRVADVGINLSLGSFYLRHVLDDLGHPVLATAAYNAGPGRARRWRADGALEGAIYAESIPFNETRDYVKKVMLNKWYYGHLIHGKSLSLAQLMGTVPGKLNRTGNATIAAAPPPSNSAGSDIAAR